MFIYDGSTPLFIILPKCARWGEGVDAGSGMLEGAKRNHWLPVDTLPDGAAYDQPVRHYVPIGQEITIFNQGTAALTVQSR